MLRPDPLHAGQATVSSRGITTYWKENTDGDTVSIYDPQPHPIVTTLPGI